MEHQIDFSFKGRYYSLGEPSAQIEHLWIVCHGQGHLAQYFIKKFQSLDNGRHLIIAPEGLSKYYLNGQSGRVGATWMTKENRLVDINNYLNFLEKVITNVKSNLNPNVKVTLFGFSQGAATISRFATQTEVVFDRLILWSGIFPPDLPPLKGTQRLENKAIFWVYGNQDPYLTDVLYKEQEAIAKQLEASIESVIFDGKHEIKEEILSRFLS
jgi:predicted esterase